MKLNAKYKYLNSIKKYKENKKYIANGASSNFRLIYNPVPLTYKYAKGSKLVDIDNNEYIDYALGAGPIVLGHAPSRVISAVKKCLEDGQLYYGQHDTEIKLAKKIIKYIPSAERVRFSSSGSESVHAAIRLARGFTNKKIIIKFDGQYHGWFDNEFISINPKNKKINLYNSYGAKAESHGQHIKSTEDIISIPWNNLNELNKIVKKYKNKIAAIITEPVMCNTGVIMPGKNFLNNLRQICDRNKILLIFDEVITGFRIKIGGAQEFYKVIPDLSIFAKGIASGFSLSCLVGKKEIMDNFDLNKIVHGGTYNASVVNTVAALKTLEVMGNKKIFKKINDIRIILTKNFLKIAKSYNVNINIQGIGSIFHVSFTKKKIIKDNKEYRETDQDQLQRFIKVMHDKNIRITSRGTWFISSAHTKKDIIRTINSFKSAITKI